jgi:hypothetical protein
LDLETFCGASEVLLDAFVQGRYSDKCKDLRRLRNADFAETHLAPAIHGAP